MHAVALSFVSLVLGGLLVVYLNCQWTQDMDAGMDAGGAQSCDVDMDDEPTGDSDVVPMDIDKVLDFPGEYQNNEFEVVQHQM